MNALPFQFRWRATLARVIGLLFLTACAARPTITPTLAPRTPTPTGPITISIVDNGAPTRLETNALMVGQALWAAGYRWHLADAIQPALTQPVSDGLTITLTRARPITLIVDGQSLATRTNQTTVGATLAEAGLALVGQDYATPALDQPLPADGVIRIVRVREETLVSQETIPYETVYQAQADWEIDTVQALQAGVNGAKERRVRVRYEDGVEVSRVDEGEFVAQSPTPYVIGYGTNIVLRTLDTPDGPVEYWRSYTMYATSYAAKFLSRPPDSPNYGRTASGKILTKGLVAIDRSLIAFGTRMYVPGYGFAEAADTGGGVKGRFIDLGFDDWNYESWHWEVTVYFLTPIPPADQIRWIIPFTVP